MIHDIVFYPGWSPVYNISRTYDTSIMFYDSWYMHQKVETMCVHETKPKTHYKCGFHRKRNITAII